MSRASAPIDGLVIEDNRQTKRAGVAIWLLASLLIFIGAGLLFYSQTWSFVWDEGFHLLAAQLILAGKTPYLDFCFPQTFLNAYWNAGWMWLFGEGWRVTHVVASLATWAAIMLSANFVFRSFPVSRWRTACTITTAVLAGLNIIVLQFGTIAQAYAMGMVLSVVGFRVAVLVPRQAGWVLALTAGFFASAAAGCTMLTAPVAPVLFIWMLVYSNEGSRSRKAIAFCAGAAIPFLPFFALFVRAPRQVFFNVIAYQAVYRRVHWDGATAHDVDVLGGWLNSTQAELMGVLAIAGVLFISRKSGWDRARRAEFYLTIWLAVALIAYIATAHPTFQRYFVFAVPFIAIAAAPGLYDLGSRLGSADRPSLPTIIVASLMALSLAKAVFDDRDSFKWKDYEDTARKVAQVTPPGARLYADELVYFLLRRTPPSGMEFSYGHSLELSKSDEALLHVISKNELNDAVKSGQFYTVQSCNDDRIEELKLPSLFPHKAEVGDCSIFWGKVRKLESKK